MMNNNDIRIEIIDPAGTTLPDISQALRRATEITYETFFPGGRYGEGAFTVPLDTRAVAYVQGAYMVRFWHGLTLVYEGYIDALETVAAGVRVTCTGAWGHILGRRHTARRWADNRLTQDAWAQLPENTGAGVLPNKFSQDWNQRLGIVPKAISFGSGEATYFYYAMPTGEKIKRITFDYDFDEDTQNWIAYTLSAANVAFSGAAIEDTISSTGAGSKDITLSTARQYVAIGLYSNASQTPPSNGDVRLVITNVQVYAELDSADTEGTVNFDVLARDTLAALGTSVISSSAAFITSNTFSLSPFIARNGAETYASVLSRAAQFGDASQRAWGVFLVSGAINGGITPVIISQAYPALLDFAELTTTAAEAGGRFRRGYDEVRNYIIVTYTDLNNIRQTLTPDGAAALKDDTSIALYGQREFILSLPGPLTSAQAQNYGERALSENKDARWQSSAPLTLREWVRGGNGQIVPACEVYAGVRLRVSDFAQDITERPFVGLIQRTRYNHDTQTVQVWLSQPDPLAVQLARLRG